MLLLTFVSAVSAKAQTQTDLTSRQALYFTGTKTSSIDLKTDVYAAKDATLNVSAAIAKSCDNNTCEFNVGFIGFRSGNVTTELSSYGLISVAGTGLFGNTIHFAASDATRSVVVPVKLKPGMNKLTFTIDPYKKIAETNERNNTFSVSVLVTPGRGNAGSN